MKITLQYFDSCPNWKVTDERVKTVISAHALEAELQYQLIESPTTPRSTDFTARPRCLWTG